MQEPLLPTAAAKVESYEYCPFIILPSIKQLTGQYAQVAHTYMNLIDTYASQ